MDMQKPYIYDLSMESILIRVEEMGCELTMLVLFSLFLASFVLMIAMKKTRSMKKLPPGPRKLPIIGNLHQLGSLPHISLQKLSAIHGPLMLLQLGSVPTLVVSSADVARDIFKTHDRTFSDRPQLYAGSKWSYGCSDVAFAPYGEFWRQVRKIVVLELLSNKRVQSFREAREAEVAALIQSVRASLSDPINFSELILQSSNNFVCRVVFGKKYNDDGEKSRRFHDVLKETQNLLGGFCLSDYFPGMTWLNKLNGYEKKVNETFGELDSFYCEVIKEHLDRERLEEGEQEDLVDVLLRVQKDPNHAIALTDDQLKGMLTNIFVAGTDTSAAALVWTMSELIRNPNAMKRAQEEVRGAVEGNGRVKESDLAGLVYLKAVLKEGLRVHPPAPLLIPRVTTEACTIGDYTIHARTRVLVNAKSISRDPEYWQDPDKFWPERFLNSSVDFKGQDYEFLPFGVGRRACPGIQFAVQLIELELANLLHGFNWDLPQGMRVEDLDMEEDVGLTMHKKVPLWLVARPVAL